MRSTIRTLVLLPAAAALLAFPQPSLSQAARTKALTIENIFGGQGGGGVRQVTISPDGTVIAMKATGRLGAASA